MCFMTIIPIYTIKLVLVIDFIFNAKAQLKLKKSECQEGGIFFLLFFFFSFIQSASEAMW